MATPSNVIKTGPLMYNSGLGPFKTFKMHTASVCDQGLVIYKRDNPTEILKVYNLEQCSVWTAEKETGKSNTFQVYHPSSHPTFFRATNDVELYSWMDACQLHIDAKRKEMDPAQLRALTADYTSSDSENTANMYRKKKRCSTMPLHNASDLRSRSSSVSSLPSSTAAFPTATDLQDVHIEHERTLSEIRKHRLAEAFLSAVVGIGWEEVHEYAAKLESVMDEKMEDGMDRAAKYPRTCPHGDPIPTKDGVVEPVDDVQLANVPANAFYTVKRVKTKQKELLDLFLAVGLTPGNKFHLGETKGSDVSVFVGEATHTVPVAAMEHLFVVPSEAMAAC